MPQMQQPGRSADFFFFCISGVFSHRHKKVVYNKIMSMLSNQKTIFCENHFVFRGREIMLQQESESGYEKIIDTKLGMLPSEDAVRKCLDQQIADDWFAELEWNIFAVELEPVAPDPAGMRPIPLRDFFAAADEKTSSLAARAKALLSWRRSFRFCPVCGKKLNDDKVLTARTCPGCGKQFFPRIEPAVITLVTDKDKLLLVRHAQRIQNVWACISGFIETGETPEQAVLREVKEETGIEVTDIRYVGSQAWPFPDQLMLAYRAEYKSGNLALQASEIQEAQWFSRDSLPQIPQPGSIAHKLITGVFG